jgi:hypothetical protein
MPRPDASVTLQFRRKKLIVGEDTDIRNQLSAVVLDGDHLWVACDEGCRLERLSRSGDGRTFADHEVVGLDTVLDLPAPVEQEADIEGLAVDEGWLWLVGSHSVKRKQPKGKSESEIARKLLETSRDGNRHLLARIPIDDGALRRKDGARRAASLATTAASSALLDAIRRDEHLKPFVALPGKDNGFDIEGLAVRGLRVWVGLRGPVLREWCCVLELQLEVSGGELRLVDGDAGPYRKHFFNLGGLGVRDLALLDDDLLILAGPVMVHDGPSGIWRWKNGAKGGAEAVPKHVKQVIALPHGKHEDKPEGLTIFEHGRRSTSVLVVFDAPAEKRKAAPSGVRADIFRL